MSALRDGGAGGGWTAVGPAMLDQLLPKANVVFFPLAGTHPLSARVPRCPGKGVGRIQGRTLMGGGTISP